MAKTPEVKPELIDVIPLLYPVAPQYEPAASIEGQYFEGITEQSRIDLGERMRVSAAAMMQRINNTLKEFPALGKTDPRWNDALVHLRMFQKGTDE